VSTKIPRSTGFGESKQTQTVDRESFGEIPDDGLPARKYWTFKGVPVDELPEMEKLAITYRMTDQAVAERMRIIEEQGGPAAVVSRDKFDKRNDVRVDHVLNRGGTIHTAPNERAALAAKHVGPGMTPRFLGGRRLDSNGTRGYEIVRDEHGKEVRFGNEVLGQIPTDVYKQRRKAAQLQGESQREGLVDKIHDQQVQVYEAAGLDPALVDASKMGVVRENPY
jgi:hypothetical protein